MTKASRKFLRSQATAIVGFGCYHEGEHGTIVEAVLDAYAEPMVRIEFPSGRIATLKPSEIGAR